MIYTNIISDYNSNLSFEINKIKETVKSVLISEDKNEAKVSIILSNKQYVSDLKKKYFKTNHYTDVITFNLENTDENIDGEIYISIDDVLENSKKYSTTFNNEFSRVLIHGVLHLIGYEDESKNDKKIMRGLEEKYLVNCNEEIIILKC